MGKHRTRAPKPVYLAVASQTAAAPPSTHPAATLRSWAPLILIGAIGLAYSNSLHGPFLLDDNGSIPENASIRSLWPIGPVLFPPYQGGRTMDGRPLVNLSLAVNYAISELDVWSYHLLNLLVHIAAACVLFGVARRTLLLPRFEGRFAESATGLALTIAVIWGVHPLQTQAVTYIVQRAESMMGLWYLLTLYCVIRGETGASRRSWFTLAVVVCALGMTTKEVMATAPIVVLLYQRIFLFPSFHELLRQRWKLLAALSATWLLLVLLVLPLGGRGGSAGWGHGVSPWDYVATQFRAIVTYLKLSISPQPLVFDYGKGLDTSPGEYLPYAAVVAALLVASGYVLARRPALGFLMVAFWLILAPSSSMVPIVTQTIAEHRMYLSLACVVALLVMTGHLAWQRVVRRMDPEKRQRGLPKAAPTLLVAAVAVLLGLQTWLRNLDYQSAVSIWQDTADKVPENPRAWSNLAEQLLLAGDIDTSLRISTRLIEENPESAEPWFRRGTYRVQAGMFREAVEDFDRALELDQDSARIYQNRGAAKRRLERYESALADFDRALELDPTQVHSYRSRALTLAALGRHDEARRDAQTYLKSGGELDRALREIVDSPPQAK